MTPFRPSNSVFMMVAVAHADRFAGRRGGPRRSRQTVPFLNRNPAKSRNQSKIRPVRVGGKVPFRSRDS